MITTQWQYAPILVCVIFSWLSGTALGGKPPVTGWLEGAYVEGIRPRLRAKLDSGALTSSIHGMNKVIFERDGERWLRFDFHWHKKSSDRWFGPYTLEAPLVRKVRIKDHEDDSKKRPVVFLNLAIGGECHSVEFSVVDRSGFNYPVLLGRRFLGGNAIIDSRKTFTKATEPRGQNSCKIAADIKSKKEKHSEK